MKDRVPNIGKPMNQMLLTDDDDSSDSDNNIATNLQNKILNSTTTSVDKTFCSEVERKKGSESIFGSEDVVKSQQSVLKTLQAETKVGSFSSDEEQLSSKISELQIKSARKSTKSNKRSTLRETIVGQFSSDEDEEDVKVNNSLKLTQKNIEKILSPKKDKMVETIVGSFDSDDDETFIKPQIVPKIPPPKPDSELRETIHQPFEYSESFSSIRKSLKEELVEEIEIAAEKFSELEVDNREDFIEESDGSELEVITVLDSEEEDTEISKFNDNDEPPRYDVKDSFENCSSLNDSSAVKPDSDNTLNRFFNNPPSLHSDLAVTHSVINKYLEKPKNMTNEAKTSPNRFNLKDLNDIDEDIELDETIQSNDEQVDATLSDENDGEEISYESPEKESQETQVTAYENRQSIEVGNFQLKINLNLEITMGSSSEDEDDDNTESDEKSVKVNIPAGSPQVVITPKQSKTMENSLPSIVHEPQNQRPPSTSKKTPKIIVDEYQTPKKSDQPVPAIDEDLQKVLNELYGDAWKTPQLLKSCTKKKVREDLRKSIAANSFANCKLINIILQS